ncbi:threonyl-tRNA synthetase [Lineolata rhizophorae]|uniref:threonine--tRNA ligase n=1 Tax=Lineolata rhizophorae TaxID=578093 RepID=A0A6A6NT68_9PEZI|nr:threonyl-tRNA synthetase [Lineolata rhizophorae]
MAALPWRVRSPRMLWISSRHAHWRMPAFASWMRACSTSRPPREPALDTTKAPPKPAADHRQLGTAQSLFTTSPYSPGSPLFLPNGASMFNKLVSFLRAQYPQFGFREVVTPTMYKKSLWQTSGHWDNYAEDMYEVRGRGATGRTAGGEIGEDDEFGLKPMNCPGHCLLFASEKRSYRDLPVRLADFSALHRNEVSGSLSGLTRVRRFHQDDGHIFCMPSQVQDEIRSTLEFVELTYNTLGLGPYRLVLSTRPEDHYIGTRAEWDTAEAQLKSALDASGLEWEVNEGDGAFYGPKIDIILKDSDGKEHQTATVQLDFQLPQRFGLEYVSATPEPGKGEEASIPEQNDPTVPVIIHRAIFGSLERFLALLIEHYNGTYPFWLSPRPAMIISVSQKLEELEYIRDVADIVRGTSNTFHQIEGSKRRRRAQPILRNPIHVDVDTSNRPLGRKIREAKLKGYNHIIIAGPKDVPQQSLDLEIHNQRNKVTVRDHLVQVLGNGTPESHVKITPAALRLYFEKLVDNYL